MLCSNESVDTDVEWIVIDIVLHSKATLTVMSVMDNNLEHSTVDCIFTSQPFELQWKIKPSKLSEGWINC